MNELLIIPSYKLEILNNESIRIERRFLSGMNEYAKHWNGPVTALMDRVSVDKTQSIPFSKKEALFSIEHFPNNSKDLSRRLSKAGIVLAFLNGPNIFLCDVCNLHNIPIVYNSEYSLKTRKQIIDAEQIVCWSALKRKINTSYSEYQFRRMLPRAAGLQCNGTPTFNDYKNIQRNALLYFDSRSKISDLITEQELSAKVADLQLRKKLRLAYSGRLIRMKGVDDLLKVARALKDADFDFSLKIFGDGELKAYLQTMILDLDLEKYVTLEGFVDFQSEWLPYFKKDVDLFICCHPQGDPSCTYLEVMSCGVPIAGYSNEALEGVVKESGSGWLSPIRDVRALVSLICSIQRNRASILQAAQKAKDFALKHSFENTFKSRIAHLETILRNYGSIKKN